MSRAGAARQLLAVAHRLCHPQASSAVAQQQAARHSLCCGQLHQLAAVAHRGLSTAVGQPGLAGRLRSALQDFKQLSKFRLSALVALTASAGFVAGSEDTVDLAKLAWTSLGTLSAAACANTLNQVYEVANDRRMRRTANRPLPAGRMGLAPALIFAAASGAAGLYILDTQANRVTAELGAANILLYTAIYTPLKQVTLYNTWVGALVGALPPLMGWAAAAGQLEPGAGVLAAALFSWQMPHFMALAWLCKEDYLRGGFRMLPSLDATARCTAAVCLRHCAYLVPVGLAAMALQVASPWFAAEAAALAGVLGVGAVRFAAAPSTASARILFRGSLIYLPLLMLGLVVHRQPNTHTVDMAYIQQQLQEHWGVRLPQLQLPEVRLRPWEERLGMVVSLQQQLRCPSRVYGETHAEVVEAEGGGSGDAVGQASREAQPQQQERQQQQQP